MAVIVAIVYNLRQSTVILRYYTFMSAALLMGSLHVYFYQSTFNKFETDHKFKTFLFSLVASVVLILPVIMIGAHFHDLTYLPFYFLVTAAFVIPTCFFILYKTAISIPVKLYSKWYYPLGTKYDTPKHYELNNMIVVNFMFYKNPKRRIYDQL